MHTQNSAIQVSRYSPTHIRATWGGAGSVEEASKAFTFSRAKGYDEGKFPCRVLRIGRSTRVVTTSLLRVLDSGEPEYNGATKEPSDHLDQPHEEAPPEQTTLLVNPGLA
ncbi:hypothetical protein [Streptomyces pseudovenezuelae]|uniref:hypothetical protein n=1 Tax=Streptomyces pseudovenezuelae TaxID=67350 RepID=UPI0036EE59B2